MTFRFFVLFVVVTVAGSAHAQTPLGQGPATPGSVSTNTTPTQRVAAANSVVNSTLPVGSVPQAQAQAAGNFGPLARPESIGGQIQEAWSRPGKKQGIHVQNFCGDCVYKVRLRQYMVSAIQLPKGVKIKSADMGDSSRFEVKKRSDNTLAVKPTGAGVDSSMLVYTDDGDVYSFYLRAEGINSKSVPDVSFRIIGPQSAGMSFVEFDGKGNPVGGGGETALATHNSKDFLQTAKFDPGALRGWNQYKLWGDKKLRPEQVFRDDHFTYIQFGDKWNDVELPTAYVVVDGIDELVNTRVQGTTFIVESTHRLITLKSGQSFMCIQYKGGQ
ncbi:DNA transformation compentancy [Stappia aggregata IAM 12614]|uniref:DNA transformation compentancy n=1 Tax=Roseibium aggregatum (strain ATCC 25650 / DSM 13394 / JCM 20685 / NBRC 16684 / NCIMB 2208 / IAM 12614 / B1) TaxID=384765 RepID=A0P1U5_ROSAI|nr:TrbG/VirB9 family P-type conjugative transfer protein [Roseibium aggregatum]EAV41021.1 DNA transformation compentancy [Stappia aggregata IAM 12614] [Roseibium aggregatum IAM 12614]